MTSVLVVDDEPDIRLLLVTVLEATGYDVEEACDGASALARIRADDPPHLVLLDLKMPPPDGFTVLEAIRRERLPVKVVMISAHADEATAALALARDADAFVVKPFRTAELVDTVKRVLDGER